MSNRSPGPASAHIEALAAPFHRFNQAVVDNLEKLASLQLAAMESYSHIGLDRVRAALSVRDRESLQAYINDQARIAEAMREKLSADARTLADIGESFNAQVRRLAEQSVGAPDQPLRSRK